jgi:hypothetical protein
VQHLLRNLAKVDLLNGRVIAVSDVNKQQRGSGVRSGETPFRHVCPERNLPIILLKLIIK